MPASLRAGWLFCYFAAWTASAGAADFALADNERIVLLGNTLIEREQRTGYWETSLTALHPGKNLTFRNLGWSGDTVWGEARARFGGPADGFRHLKEHVTALQPTVLIVGYGLNESFAGSAGLPRFEQGLHTLLDTLAVTEARIVILAPLRQEDLGRPLPDPAQSNQNIRLYSDALRKVADKRGHLFVDLNEMPGDTTPKTDNGIHLSAYGYWRTAADLAKGLGATPTRWQVTIDKEGKATAAGTRVQQVRTGPLRFDATDDALPTPTLPTDAPKGASPSAAERTLSVQGLAAGKYVLHIDGKPVVTASHTDWATGVKWSRGPEFEQVERLRQTTIDKNQLYFHRWRPQNETYLFGFRKGEQGQNAKEIPQFDPLIAEREKEIARLRVPVAHSYELSLERGSDK